MCKPAGAHGEARGCARPEFLIDPLLQRHREPVRHPRRGLLLADVAGLVALFLIRREGVDAGAGRCVVELGDGRNCKFKVENLAEVRADLPPQQPCAEALLEAAVLAATSCRFVN